MAKEASKRRAKLGDRVCFRYRGLLADGSVFASSESDPELELFIGERAVFPMVEDALIGMSEGSQTVVTLESKDAYGEYSIDKIFSLKLSEIPPQIEVKLGATLCLQDAEGREFDAVVTKVGKREITVDCNHPLAGKTLHYELCLIRVF